VQLASKLDGQIQAGIEKVLTEAWESAAEIDASEERLKIAKQAAIRLIAMLSPSIRKQVTHHFTSQRWQPLITRAPKT
jgi:copper homeostasis protein CutC